VGGFFRDVPIPSCRTCRKFLEEFPTALREYQDLLTKNRIWINAPSESGCCPPTQAIDLCLIPG